MNPDRRDNDPPRRRADRRFAGLLLALALWHVEVAPSVPQNAANPLRGAWRLNVARTRYGASAERRLQETFVCDGADEELRCRIEGTRVDGRRIRGEFSAALNGGAGSVRGVADIDQVRLRFVADGVVDATFSYRGTPLFGYRAYQSEDGKSLTVVSVAPVSRAALTTSVVYDRQ